MCSWSLGHDQGEACALLASESSSPMHPPPAHWSVLTSTREVCSLWTLPVVTTACPAPRSLERVVQPRSSIYAMFDDLILLSEGACLYSGADPACAFQALLWMLYPRTCKAALYPEHKPRGIKAHCL